MSKRKSSHDPGKMTTGAQAPIGAERQQAEKQEPKKRFWRDYEPIEKFNLLLVIFTGIYSGISLGLYRTASGDLKIAKESMQQTERAYVFAIGAEMKRTGSKLRAGQKLPEGYASAVFIVHSSNTGNTPARKAITIANSCVRDGALPNDFSYPNWVNASKEGFLLPPKSPVDNYITTTPETVDMIVDGHKTLFLWGVISYFDVFDLPHKTEFCFHYTGYSLDVKNDQISFSFEQCQRHNCADDDCPESWGNNSDRASCNINN
jgi:hypothetical protein